MALPIKNLTNKNDTFTDNSVAREIHALNGNDIVHGGGGDDYIFGELGNDKLYGDAGNDILDGGKGNDLLDGGAGTLDVASYLSATSGIYVDLTYSTGQVLDDGFGYTDTLKNIEKVNGSSYTDELYGNSSANTFDGRLGDDYVYGFSGNDSLYGGQGSDYISGGQGKDLIKGGLGADYISGGYGNDTIYTEAGNDYVHYHLSPDYDTQEQHYDRGNDIITDFSRGHDTIDPVLVDSSGSEIYETDVFNYLDTNFDGYLDSWDDYASDTNNGLKVDFGALQADLYDPNGVWDANLATVTFNNQFYLTQSDFV